MKIESDGMKIEDFMIMIGSFVTTFGFIAVYNYPHPFLFLMSAFSLTLFMKAWILHEEV